MPNYLGLVGRMVVWKAPGRLAAIDAVHLRSMSRTWSQSSLGCLD
jgi:hypothetical protein